LREYFDVVIDSSVFGTEKPDPAIFRAALEALDVAPEEALFVGDLYDVDVVGARAAGMEAVLLTSTGVGQNPPCHTAASIDELVDVLLVRKTR
jgi:putative hydrolase of the HAD superfamily